MYERARPRSSSVRLRSVDRIIIPLRLWVSLRLMEAGIESRAMVRMTPTALTRTTTLREMRHRRAM